jgi:hypothetical protein
LSLGLHFHQLQAYGPCSFTSNAPQKRISKGLGFRCGPEGESVSIQTWETTTLIPTFGKIVILPRCFELPKA